MDNDSNPEMENDVEGKIMNTSHNFRIATINVRGLNRERKRMSVFNWINENKIDIALVQETYCTAQFERRFNRNWSGTIFHSHSSSKHARGVCVLVRKDFNIDVVNWYNDDCGRKILMNIDVDGKLYTIVNLYCPNDIQEREDFLNDIEEWIIQKQENDSRLIVGGDFNCVDNASDRKSNVSGKTSTSLKNLKRSLHIVDSWKLLHPDDEDYTYIDPSFRNYDSRIDLICVCEDLQHSVTSCQHKITPAPDHKAVILVIEEGKTERGKGYWKLNVSILNDEEYRADIRQIIRDTISEYINLVDKSSIWELIKVRVKEFSIRYCCERVNKKKSKTKLVESKIDRIDRELQVNPLNEALITERKKAKQELDIMFMDNAIGAHIRSRVRWVEDGERSTSYFLSIEKSRQDNNVIKSLTKDNKTYSNDEDILNIAKEFYSNLYNSNSPSPEEISTYLNHVELPALVDDKQQICEGMISVSECAQAIEKMKRNKSPGEDGLPIEFYHTFWNDIDTFLVDIYNESFDNKELPLSLRRSVMTLIYKKDDKNNIENYRPISLTNTDYRILAFVLASRLQNVIADIVKADQVAYIKDRFIGSNIRLVHDVFDLYNEKNLSGLLMFADFKKAFDSIEWEFLFQVLNKFNFGQNFKHWIKLLYTNPVAFIKNNGFFSAEFALTRGVRQGCPVSALLFILCTEVLACSIRQNVHIQGLKLDEQGSRIVKLVQYADDTTLFLKNVSDLKNAINCINEFGNKAGIELNLKKCEGLWIGANKYRQDNCTLQGIRWPSHPIKYLGIYIGYDIDKCNNLNFDEKITAIDNVLNEASKRNLTLFGKVCIIKSLALSKIVYIATCLSLPDKIIKQIDQRIFKFLWGKRDRIKRKSVINKLEDGGLNMIDLKTQIIAINAAWVSRIVTASDDDIWAYLPKTYFSRFGNNYFILKTTFTKRSLFRDIKILPNFYQEIIISYNMSKIITAGDFQTQIKTQPIWGNKFIQFKKRTLYFKSWIDEGIISISNLKINNGNLDVQYLYNKIKDKRQFHIEINILAKALKAANVNISNEPIASTSIPVHIHNTEQSFEWSNVKAKHYYNLMIPDVCLSPTSENYWRLVLGYGDEICTDIIRKAYVNKVKLVLDKKLAETNFKILNNILPCNTNLFKWKLSDTKLCCFCQEEETISHLLYHCRYAQHIWSIVSKVLNYGPITHDMVIFGNEVNQAQNHILSLVVYFIYKEWLVCSLEKEIRRQYFSTNSFKHFFIIRKNVYSFCSNSVWNDVNNALDLLINNIQ